MPRKTDPYVLRIGRWRGRFNEAAARCRGKPLKIHLFRDRRSHASMRPRPDAAENPHRAAARAAAQVAASMRPRPDAAENRWVLRTNRAATLALQ